MGDNGQDIDIEEQEVFERERGLAALEAQMFEQEQAAEAPDPGNDKRLNALKTLASFVADQEASLLARAEAIGPRALTLVREALGSTETVVEQNALGDDMIEAREAMLERRIELVEIREQLLEEREALYAQRMRGQEKVQGRAAELEKSLMDREAELTKVLRKLITSAASFGGDDGDESGDDDQEGDSSSLTASSSEEPEATVESDGAGDLKPHQAQREVHDIGHDPMVIESGLSSGEGGGGVKESDRPKKTERADLSVVLSADGGHYFFYYANDEPSDLPGLFVQTDELMEVDEAVRLVVSYGDDTMVAKGLVCWRQEQTDKPSGLGIELTGLGRGGKPALEAMVSAFEPRLE